MGKMKKSVKIFITVIIMLVIAGVTVWAATMGKANSSYVRIRQKATTESEILDILMEGDQVEILGEEGDWYKVKAKGQTGYVSKAFITKGETTTNTDNNSNTNNNDNNTTKTATITTRIYKVAEGTNVYILPLLSANSIGTVNAGDSLDLINSAGLWGYIKTNNLKGWVRIDKLSSEEVQTTVPAEEVPAEEKPAEEKPAEEKPAEEKPAEEKPAEEKPVEEKPAEEKPAEEKPAEEKPVEEKPAEEKPAEEKPAEEKPAETPIQEKTMYVCVTAINVRKEPNTTSDVISGATLNKDYTVVAEVDGWYKVKVNGDSFGYIRKDLLSDKKTEETSRSLEKERTVASTQNNANTQATQNTQNTSAKTNTNTAQQTATKTNTAQQTKSTGGVTGEQVAEYAKQFLGCSYVYAAAGPSSFDCSGLTMYVYKHFGYNLSHSSKVQATQGTKVTGELKPGDILVFSNDGKQVGHVGLYLGNDKFIHASDYSTGVIISNLHDSWNIKKYWGARRIIQ